MNHRRGNLALKPPNQSHQWETENEGVVLVQRCHQPFGMKSCVPAASVTSWNSCKTASDRMQPQCRCLAHPSRCEHHCGTACERRRALRRVRAPFWGTCSKRRGYRTRACGSSRSAVLVFRCSTGESRIRRATRKAQHRLRETPSAIGAARACGRACVRACVRACMRKLCSGMEGDRR